MKTPHIKTEGTSNFQIGELKENIIHYDFEKIKTYLNIKGHMIFDKNFRLYKEDELLLFKLCCYYIQDHWACANAVPLDSVYINNSQCIVSTVFQRIHLSVHFLVKLNTQHLYHRKHRVWSKCTYKINNAGV
jgi:hypothetical protein